jgi:hypothetical protein
MATYNRYFQSTRESKEERESNSQGGVEDPKPTRLQRVLTANEHAPARIGTWSEFIVPSLMSRQPGACMRLALTMT